MNLKSSVCKILLYSKSNKLLLARIYFNKYYVQNYKYIVVLHFNNITKCNIYVRDYFYVNAKTKSKIITLRIIIMKMMMIFLIYDKLNYLIMN